MTVLTSIVQGESRLGNDILDKSEEKAYTLGAMREPTTLQEAIVYFSDPDRCRGYLVARRWPGGATCPRCGTNKVALQRKHNRWQCSKHHDCRQFTLKTGTIFEDSPFAR